MSEIREDIITGNHVVIASKRGKRPHDFEQQEETKDNGGYCPFCYGNEADTPPEILAVSDDPSRKKNETGWRIRVVPNKFAALDINEDFERQDGFYKKMSGVGAAEVLIESHLHDSSFGTHDLPHVTDIIKSLQKRYNSLKEDDRLKYVQIFKNHGGTAGASLEHPHWQIMATPLVPAVVKGELDGAQDYFRKNGSCAYCDILSHELRVEDRIIETGEEFIAFTPYASRYPFETWVMPQKHQCCFGAIKEEEINDLAKILQKMIRKIEVGFDYPPYNIVLHTAPFLPGIKEEYHWHLEILPRLSITAGFELGTGNFINPTPPEIAAESMKKIDV